MKILHVLQSNTFSGAENVVCQIIKMFEKDANLKMAYASPDGQINEALRERGIYFFPMTSLCHNELARIVKEYNPDIIHAHDIRASVEVSLFSKQAKIVHTIHGNDLKMRKISLKSILYYLSSIKANHIFWVSSTCLKQYKFYFAVKKKSTVLCNVVDSQRIIEKCNEDHHTYNYDVIFIGRMEYPKNPQRMVRIFAKVVDKYPGFRAAIVGNGKMADNVKLLAEEYCILKNVDFLGFMSNPYKVLKDSKVLLLTSDWEGTPMVVLEAVALGKPIVSTPVDGVCDIIQNNVNGYCSWDENDLSNKIIELISNDKLYKKFCKNQLEKNLEINNIAKYKQQLEIVYYIK